jgi:WD40 repeat protein
MSPPDSRGTRLWRGHTGAVLSVAFSLDGKTLVFGSYDKTLRLWDAATGQPRSAPLEGHTAVLARFVDNLAKGELHI